MKPKRGFLRWYLFLTLAFGMLGLLDSLATFFDVVNNVYVYVVVILSIFFFLYNILVIPIFHAHHVERIAYVLPIYHLFSFLLFFGFGLLTTSARLLFDWLWMVVVGAGFLSAIFEIVFSAYLMKKLDLFHLTSSESQVAIL